MWSVPITVPAASVPVALPGFVSRVDLSTMPPAWWAQVAPAGTNIRVLDSLGALVPCDVIYADAVSQQGECFFRADLAAGVDNTFTIVAGDVHDPIPVIDPVGRNAVWVDYAFVLMFPELVDRTGLGAVLGTRGDAPFSGHKAVFPSARTAGWRFRGGGLAPSSDWTMSASAAINLADANLGMISWSAYSAANDTRESLLSSGGQASFGVWNSSNGYMLDPGPWPELQVPHRFHVTKLGTTRSIWRDGALGTSGAVRSSSPGAGTDTLYVGYEDNTEFEGFIGDLWHVYVRKEVLSADWIAAEYASWETASFFTVGAGAGTEPVASPLKIWDGQTFRTARGARQWDPSTNSWKGLPLRVRPGAEWVPVVPT